MTSAPDFTMTLPPAVFLDLDGHGNAVVQETATATTPDTPRGKGHFRWVHLQRDAPATAETLAAVGLDTMVVEALTAEETRPRCTVHGEGVLVNLRGVNLNPGAEPEDMISVRLWLEETRVIGVWVRHLNAVSDLVEATQRGQGPTSPGDLVAKLALRLADRAEPSVAALNERIDQLEEQLFDPQADVSRADLSGVRRSSIVLRRYMMPQKDALTTLQIEDVPWLHDGDRARVREAAERVFRLGEDLDAIRDRAQVVHDQLMDQRSERMNHRMLLLAIVSAIFLPLGLLTGLLGINVGGMPGADNSWAFGIVCVILVVSGGLLYFVFKRLGMFR